MAVELDGFAGLAAQQLIDRHATTLAQNVPQSAIDAAERVIAFGTRAEILLHISRLPDVLDLIAALADHERLKTGLDISLRGSRHFLAGCRTQTIKAGLAGDDLHDRPVRPAGRRADQLNILDGERRHAAAPRPICRRE